MAPNSTHYGALNLDEEVKETNTGARGTRNAALALVFGSMAIFAVVFGTSTTSSAAPVNVVDFTPP